MTSSSAYMQYYPYNGRLHGASGWCSSTSRDGFIQVDMGALKSVCAVATQGKKNGSFVKSYKLSFSLDGASWIAYKENDVDKV